ncbi:MAG: aminoglycoside phosphotransferase family protein, partial [Arthrobacter sp.]
LHGQARRLDEEYEFRATAKTIRWLDRQHGIEPHVEREVRCRLAESRPQPLEPVPTHGAGSPGTGSAIGAA